MSHSPSEDYYDDNYENDIPAKKSGFGVVVLILAVCLIVGTCVLGLLAALLLPALSGTRRKAGKVKCANNLKGIAIASILYSNDLRFFPHMTDRKKENSAENVTDVFRTLVQRKYIDTPETFVCPNSDDLTMSGSNDVLLNGNPKEWDWMAPKSPGVAAIKDPTTLSVFDNDQLSYTYRRKFLNGSNTRSDTFLAADKSLMSNPGDEQGNHIDGFNAVFADGHAEFIPVSDRALMKTMYEQLRMKIDKSPH